MRKRDWVVFWLIVVGLIFLLGWWIDPTGCVAFGRYFLFFALPPFALGVLFLGGAWWAFERERNISGLLLGGFSAICMMVYFVVMAVYEIL